MWTYVLCHYEELRRIYSGSQPAASLRPELRFVAAL